MTTMSRRAFLKRLGAASALAGLAAVPQRLWAAEEQRPLPNIVLVLADDLGFEALGCYGAKAYQGLGPVRTPNLDALAAGGLRFTQCFATPVCSPARSELLTGRYNFRTGSIDIAGRSGAVKALDTEKHPTLPAALQAAGYTTGVVGKWHLGPGPSAFPTPDTAQTDSPHAKACGFEYQYIFAGAHLSNYGKPKPGEYTPEWFHQAALGFMERSHQQQRPFFLYYASPIPHVPLMPTPLNPDDKPGNANFPYVIEYLDAQVGDLLKKLDTLGIRENTLVLFTGDNGTNRVVTEMQDGRTISGGKAGLQDTGAWVPLIASWPGTVRPGVCDDLVDFTDVMPTALEVARTTPQATVDGVSFAPRLRGGTPRPREWVCVYHVNRFFVRDAAWKLREDGSLYDIRRSPMQEELIAPAADTPASKQARARLQAVADRLAPLATARAATGGAEPVLNTAGGE